MVPDTLLSSFIFFFPFSFLLFLPFNDRIHSSVKLILISYFTHRGVIRSGNYSTGKFSPGKNVENFPFFSGSFLYCKKSRENMLIQEITSLKKSEGKYTKYQKCVPPLGMRILVMLLLDTLPMLGNVLLLCFFVFFIFGIIGVQLWAGLLRQRCYLDLPIDLNKYNNKYYYQNEYNYSLPE